MKAGYSEVDITPEIGIELSGYGWYLGRKAEKITDRLYARSIAVEDHNKRLLLINCDLIAIDDAISDHIRQELSHKIEIEKSNIMIACTHTHTGPATGKLVGCGERDEKYLNILPKLLIKAGMLAVNNMKEIKEIKTYAKEIKPIGYNRAIENGPVDKFVRGIIIYFNGVNPLAVLSYGCHPVARGIVKEISADYPGEVVLELNKNGLTGIFLTGFCGDIDPLIRGKENDERISKIINEYGNRIATTAISNMGDIKPMTKMKLDAFEINVNLNLQHYGDFEIDAQVKNAELNKNQNAGFLKVVKMWADEMRKRIRELDNPYIEEETVQVFRIGNTAVIGFPSEVFTGIGDIIRNEIPKMNIITLGNVNTTMRYIPVKEDIINNGYASIVSCFLYQRLPIVEGEGERIAKIIADEVKKRCFCD